MGQVTWGCDVGTKRIAIATDTGKSWTLTLATDDGARRLWRAYEALQDFAVQLARDHPPLIVWVERPAGKPGHVPPVLLDHVGVAQAALYGALAARYAHPVSVLPISVAEWKKAACGFGNASKDQVREWGESQGFTADLQDEYDAYGIAVAGRHLTSVPVAA